MLTISAHKHILKEDIVLWIGLTCVMLVFLFNFDLMFFFIGGRRGRGLCDSWLISSYLSSIASLPPPTDFKRDFCHVVL